jgi:CBS domain-containing protein
MELKTDLFNSKDSQQPMFVEKWMTPDPVTVQPDETISSVALEMNRRRIRHFPVCEPTRSGARMVGIVAKYDIARGFPNDLNPFSVEVTEESVPKPVSSVMTKRVVTVTPDCPIEEAARLLRSNRIGSLPVLRDTQLIGIITEPDLFEAFISMTAAKSGGTRIFIESDFNDSPVPAVLEFCRKNRVDILSMMSFHENRLRRRDMSIFRFDGRLLSGFVAEMAALGYRVVSVGN